MFDGPFAIIEEDDGYRVTPDRFIDKPLREQGPLRPDFSSSCKGKIGYESTAAARAIIARCKRLKSTRVYRCIYCGQFHIGNDGNIKECDKPKKEESYSEQYQ